MVSLHLQVGLLRADEVGSVRQTSEETLTLGAHINLDRGLEWRLWEVSPDGR